ncbi:helix-turn-helix transcriptional regulator [Clostridium botulinum]|nr:helix-turn-helix transcriptional regulator [Clostridium botulinum]KOM89546.1 hypothetical protein ACP51_02305 [Clostridium botulinum]KOR61214.1 hypothetical protein ADT22_08020 [Clostridium botulinum]
MIQLVNFRVKYGLTQQEMSKKIGTTLTFYSKVELGLRNPSYNFIVKFKKAFPKVDVDNIFFKIQLHEKC